MYSHMKHCKVYSLCLISRRKLTSKSAYLHIGTYATVCWCCFSLVVLNFNGFNFEMLLMLSHKYKDIHGIYIPLWLLPAQSKIDLM